MSRSLDPERPRNYIQERKNKKKKNWFYFWNFCGHRERQRVQEKKFKWQNNKIHWIKFGYYPDANNFEIEDSDIQKNWTIHRLILCEHFLRPSDEIPDYNVL